jgi:lipoprotein-releasing system permease protein
MLAMRYLGAKREHGGLAFISVVSVIGITLGVWALILTMSIMNGFRLELISKIVGFEPHVFIDTRGVPQVQVETLMADLRSGRASKASSRCTRALVLRRPMAAARASRCAACVRKTFAPTR